MLIFCLYYASIEVLKLFVKSEKNKINTEIDSDYLQLIIICMTHNNC